MEEGGTLDGTKGGGFVESLRNFRIYPLFSVFIGTYMMLGASGIIFGWSALVEVLRREKLYLDLCEVGEEFCGAQAVALNKVFTFGFITLMFSQVFSGFFIDFFGMKIPLILGSSFNTIGSLLIALSSAEPSGRDFFIPAFICYGIAGPLIMLPNFQLGNLFKEGRGRVLTLMSSLWSSAGYVFLTFNVIQSFTGFSFRVIFLGYSIYGISNIIISALLTPRRAFREKDRDVGFRMILQEKIESFNQVRSFFSTIWSKLSSIGKISNGEEEEEEATEISCPHCESILLRREAHVYKIINSTVDEKIGRYIPISLKRWKRVTLVNLRVRTQMCSSCGEYIIGAYENFPFWKQVLSFAYFGPLICMVCGILGIAWYLGTVSFQLQEKGDQGIYRATFNILSPAAFVFAPVVSIILENISTGSGFVLTIVSMIFLLLISSAPLEFQFFSFVLLAFLRMSLFAIVALDITTKFGFRNMGKLLSFASGMAGFASLLPQLLLWLTYEFFGGNFLIVNIFVSILLLVPLMFAIYMMLSARILARMRKKIRKDFDLIINDKEDATDWISPADDASAEVEAYIVDLNE